MNSEIFDLKRLVKELSLSDELSVIDIPDIGLYMEQIIHLIDSKLGMQKRSPEQKFLTKTMINNYTKAGLLMPPVNKKYYRDHIILLVLIYYLKNILSINDIKTLFAPILNNINTRDDDLIPLDEIYSTFLELKNEELKNCFAESIEKYNFIKDRTQKLENNNQETAELFLTVLMLVAQSNAQKRLAEQIIDNYFRHK